MTSLDPSHIPHLAAREKHAGNSAAIQVRPRSGSGSGSAKHVAVIPDLRFERSYLKSIAPYVRTRRVAAGADGIGEAREVVDVEWKKVLWITARDQLFSPLVQGSLWSVLILLSVSTFHIVETGQLQGSRAALRSTFGCEYSVLLWFLPTCIEPRYTREAAKG